MTIKTSVLKSFASYASEIETSNTLPILSYWYIGGGKIVKNNLKEFVCMDIEDGEDEWLVDEKSMLAFVNSSNPEIVLSKKDNRVLISDLQTKIFSPTDNPKHFPIMPKATGAGFTITAYESTNIGKAASHILAEDIMPVKSHIYIGNGVIFGSDGFATFRSESNLPIVVLSKKLAVLIGELKEGCYYKESETFSFIEYGEVLFGFAKDEAKFNPDLKSLMEYDKKSPSFEVNRKQLLDFNNLCIQQGRVKEVNCQMEIKDNTLLLSMKQPEWGVDIERSHETNSKDMQPFTYNPVYMNKILKNISDEKLTIYRTHETRIVFGGDDWDALLMGIAF